MVRSSPFFLFLFCRVKRAASCLDFYYAYSCAPFVSVACHLLQALPVFVCREVHQEVALLGMIVDVLKRLFY